MSSYTENLINQIIEASDGKDWDSAVSEWVIEDCIEDEDHSSCCICGKEELRFLYTIRNQYNGKELFPIGSRCIRKFGSSRKVRDRDGEKPNKSEEEMIVSIPISKSFGDFNLVVKALKLSG